MIWLLCTIVLPYLGFSQNRVVSGRITDPNGNALPNVNVILKQSAQGTVTDAEGKFKLPVPVLERKLLKRIPIPEISI
jgi:hypothetical protein